jgi:acetolactate synthase-1/3 small subunit
MNTNPGVVRHHIISVLVENKPGVLARVSGLFARRGYNIFSLAVAPTDDDRRSRITIVVDVESAPLEQIVKQLDKLINVLQIDELAPGDAVERELLLATVESPQATRQIFAVQVEVAGARILDAGDDTVTVSLEGTPDELDQFAILLATHPVVALQRTGRVALPKIG